VHASALKEYEGPKKRRGSAKEDVKEGVKEDVKEGVKEDVKEGVKEDVKEDVKEGVKEDVKEGAHKVAWAAVKKDYKKKVMNGLRNRLQMQLLL
jgi:cation transport regulator ChaB